MYARVVMSYSDFGLRLKLDSAMKERLRRLASARRRSPHWIMREAVEQYVEREEKREALAAWAGYQTTGMHVMAKEADAWLAKLAAGKHAVIPKATFKWSPPALLDVACLQWAGKARCPPVVRNLP